MHLNFKAIDTFQFISTITKSFSGCKGRPCNKQQLESCIILSFHSLHFYSSEVRKTAFYDLLSHWKTRKVSYDVSGKQVAWNKRGIYRSLNSFFCFRQKIIKTRRMERRKKSTTPPKIPSNGASLSAERARRPSNATPTKINLSKRAKGEASAREGLFCATRENLFIHSIKTPRLLHSTTKQRNIISQFSFLILMEWKCAIPCFFAFFDSNSESSEKKTHITTRQKHLLYHQY